MVRLLENMEKPSQLWMHIWVLNFNNYTWIFNLLETHGETISTADGKRENQNISLKPLTSHHTMQLSTAWRWWPNGPGWTVHADVQDLRLPRHHRDLRLWAKSHTTCPEFAWRPSPWPRSLIKIEETKLPSDVSTSVHMYIYICIYICTVIK